MIALRAFFVFVAASLLAACTSTTIQDPLELEQTFDSELPVWIGEEARRSVVMVYDPVATQLSTAIVIGPKLLLTALHAVDDLVLDAAGWARTQVAGRDVLVRIVDQGDLTEAHGDWAILQTKAERFEEFATLHRAAFDPNWSPPVGVEIALLGYAAGFFPSHEVDLSLPSPGITTRVTTAPRDTTLPESWYSAGGLRDLGGLSGGAAMVLSPISGNPEVIGVFTAQLRTRIVDERQAKFLGMTMRRDRIEREGLLYEIQRLPSRLKGHLASEAE